MTLPPKIAGGNQLDCGHRQVLPAYRLVLSAAGIEQAPVWCVECEDYTRLAPGVATQEQVDYEKQMESRWDYQQELPEDEPDEPETTAATD